MNRIAATFSKLKSANQKVLIPFITAGDPKPEVTVPLMHTLVKAGANLIELGVPFSDPMADGPTIQRSSERALANGVSLANVIAMVAEFRKTDTLTPVVLMGYANPVEAMGVDHFISTAKESGVDGILVVDYPPEESTEWAQQLSAAGIDPIFLLSPTTPIERVKQVAKLAQGYLYYVSLKGVTGASHLDLTEVQTKLAQVRTLVSIPIGVGFGIRDPQTAKAISKLADAVVIGSRIIEEIEKTPENSLLETLSNLISSMRSAIDETN